MVFSYHLSLQILFPASFWMSFIYTQCLNCFLSSLRIFWASLQLFCSCVFLTCYVLFGVFTFFWLLVGVFLAVHLFSNICRPQMLSCWSLVSPVCYHSPTDISLSHWHLSVHLYVIILVLEFCLSVLNVFHQKRALLTFNQPIDRPTESSIILPPGSSIIWSWWLFQSFLLSNFGLVFLKAFFGHNLSVAWQEEGQREKGMQCNK